MRHPTSPSLCTAAVLPNTFRDTYGYDIDVPRGSKLKDVLVEAEAAGVVRLQNNYPASGGPPVLVVVPARSAVGPLACITPCGGRLVDVEVEEIIRHEFFKTDGAAAGREMARHNRQHRDRGPVEVVLSFDTTGSMYGHLDEVRRNLAGLIKTLTSRVPDIRIGVIAHGDYCDADTSYVIKFLPLMTDYNKLTDFIAHVGATGGGDAPECYELALNKANKAMGWSAGARARALVLVGDANPHEVGYAWGGKTVRIDWRNQLKALAGQHVQIYAVHAGGAVASRQFYETLASETRGRYIPLAEMGSMRDLVAAVCIHTSGDTHQLDAYEREVRAAGRMTRETVRVLVEIRKTVVRVVR